MGSCIGNSSLRNVKPIGVRFIPYSVWQNRGRSEMTVWLPLAALILSAFVSFCQLLSVKKDSMKGKAGPDWTLRKEDTFLSHLADF